jgi:tetratricopeptide (TPR) repeat protein
MDQEEADIDLIERRISGDLSPAELKAFDERVAADLAFAEKVDDYVAIINGIKNVDSLALSDEVALWEKELQDEAKVARVVAINPWKKYMIAAAVAAILVTTFVFINRPSDVDQQQLFTAYFVPYEDLITVREEDDGSEALATAMAKYNRKEYRDAIPEFLRYLEKNPRNDQALFYLGISYLGDKKASDAISVFEQLETRAGSYADHVSWYLALADVLRDDIVSAKARLENIARDSNHDFSMKANQLLDEL